VEYKQFSLCARLLSYSQKRLTTPFPRNITGRKQAVAYFNTSENLHVIKTNFKPLTIRKKNLIHDITHYTFLIPQMWRDRVDNLVRKILCPARTLDQSQIINPLMPPFLRKLLQIHYRWQRTALTIPTTSGCVYTQKTK